MRRRTRTATRVLPDGTPLQNRLLAALPAADYDRIAKQLRLQSTVVGATLHEHGRRIDDVYFPIFPEWRRVLGYESHARWRAGGGRDRRSRGHARHRRVPGRSLGIRAHAGTGAR